MTHRHGEIWWLIAMREKLLIPDVKKSKIVFYSSTDNWLSIPITNSETCVKNISRGFVVWNKSKGDLDFVLFFLCFFFFLPQIFFPLLILFAFAVSSSSSFCFLFLLLVLFTFVVLLLSLFSPLLWATFNIERRTLYPMLLILPLLNANFVLPSYCRSS